MITNKIYYCPLCKNEETHSTNHIGEIYCNCKQCGNSPLYCRDMNYSKLEYKEAIIHYYIFSTDQYRQLNQYEILKDYLANILRYKLFDVIWSNMYKTMQGIMLKDLEIIKLYKPFQWEDQFVSSIGRVHNWKEAVYPNKKVKEGYWLEILEEKEKENNKEDEDNINNNSNNSTIDVL